MRPALALLLIALPLQAGAASFDCAKASHPVEKMVCASPTLSKLDEDLAQAFRQRLAVVLDKNALRGQQKDWNAVLRTRCAKGCPATDIETQYREQVASLKGEWEEMWSANYKSSYEGQLDLTARDSGGFSFRLVRVHVDEPDTALCRIPAAEAPAALARMRDDRHAQWSEGSCKMDFTLERDARSSVVSIRIDSRGCEKYCKAGQLPDDRYLSENNWVPGNQ